MIKIELTFTTIAAAIAFLAAGDAAAGTTHSDQVIGTQPAPAPTPTAEKPGKATKASKSAAPADAPASANKPDDAAGQASATTEDKPKIRTYADTDLPDRIKAIVGGKTKIPDLKGLLAEFEVATGKDLKPEQLDSFAEKLAAIEAAEPDLG